MGLRFDPVGGGQFKQALKSIIEAESAPLRQVEARKVREEGKIKLFGEFKGKFANFEKTLSEFSDFKKLRELKVDMGDGGNFASVTIDKEKAQVGSYTIQIEQMARKTAILSNSFSSADEPNLGIGFIVAEKTNGDTSEIYVDEGNSSLQGIANIINRENGLPFRASVVKDVADPEKPWRLICSAKGDGTTQELSFPDFYFLDGSEDIYVDDNVDAQNALLYLEGFPIEAESNDINDFLQGINLHLKQARPDQPFTFTVTEDHQKVAGKVKALVDQVNGILEFINKQNQVDEKTDTKNTFTGDTGLQTIEYRLRNILHEGFPVGDVESDSFRFGFLNEIGIEFGKAGLLNFSEDKFTKALEKNYDATTEIISGEYGIASQMKTIIQGYTRAGGGILTMREQSMRSKIKQMDVDIENKQRRLDQRTQNLTDQFSRLQASLSNMQRQGQYLSATMGGGGGGNLVQQLLGG